MCRGSSLSDPRVISILNQSFVSLELNITDMGFPDCLQALKSWEQPFRNSAFYQGAFANSVVLGPTGSYILGRSGGGRRWEIDSAVVYCPDKFVTYLEMCRSGWKQVQAVAHDAKLAPRQRSDQISELIADTLARTREYSESQRQRAER